MSSRPARAVPFIELNGDSFHVTLHPQPSLASLTPRGRSPKKAGSSSWTSKDPSLQLQSSASTAQESRFSCKHQPPPPLSLSNALNMNRILLNRGDGFTVGPTVNACTKVADVCARDA